jgi:pilus assembly protein CpaB
VRRRVVAAVSAVLLALVGGVLLLAYVGAADDRALADLETTAVLVVTEPVAAGATAEQLAAAAEVRQLPRLAVAPGTATSVSDLAGLVSTSALEPGEQVLRSRFADPVALAAEAGLEIPRGLHQVSLQLEPERALGGALTPGARVGVFLSVTDKEQTFTQLGLHKVLVTAVTGVAPAPGEEGADATAPPTEALTVTLALSGPDAQRLVFAAEHGTVWLSAEPDEAPGSTTRATPKGNSYR